MNFCLELDKEPLRPTPHALSLTLTCVAGALRVCKERCERRVENAPECSPRCATPTHAPVAPYRSGSPPILFRLPPNTQHNNNTTQLNNPLHVPSSTMTTPLPTKHLVHLSNLLYGINPDQHRYYSLNPLGKPTSDNPQQQSQNPPPIPSAPPIPSVPLSEWTSFSDDIAFGMEAFETYLEPDQETRALLKTEVTSLRPPVIPRTTHSNGNALVLSRLLSQVLPAVNCLLEEGPTRFQHVLVPRRPSQQHCRLPARAPSFVSGLGLH